ncbi:hypothetical protein TSUD_123880 [Trifolium subterraneum]|uniref:CASP-like protein n=1 Tax=Trifolium subterraneum TaxID=3900 RepID=A0A2Z6NJK7_TRISU|nr:hypothetical protein TSUD_123880 [Trifolium subterraneum]
MMMEIESGTEISPSPSMQIMTRPATATPATDDDQELEEGNTTSFLRTAETFLRLLPIAYSLLSAVLVAVPRPSARRVWTIFFLDQVVRFLYF